MAILVLAILAFLPACAGTGQDSETNSSLSFSGEASPVPAPPRPDPPKVIYALIDRSSSYQGYTGQALNRLVELLDRVIQPGDEVIAAWIDSNSGDPGRVFFQGQVRAVEYPLFPPEVVCSQDSTTMQIAECIRRQQERDLEVKSLIDAWESDRRQAVEEFKKQMIPAIKDTGVYVDDTGTRIYEALYEASSFFDSLRDPSDPIRRKLLIFSDMQESSDDRGDEMPVRLNGVDVVVAMYYSEGSGLRERTREQWTSIFQDAGANSVEFFTIAASTLERLARPLLR